MSPPDISIGRHCTDLVPKCLQESRKDRGQIQMHLSAFNNQTEPSAFESDPGLLIDWIIGFYAGNDFLDDKSGIGIRVNLSLK